MINNPLNTGVEEGPLQKDNRKAECSALVARSDTCIHLGVIAHAVCSDTNDYLFWDGIHPTHTVHIFLADQALQALH